MKNGILLPTELHKISSKVFFMPLKGKDYIGTESWELCGSMHVWKNKAGIKYGIPLAAKDELGIEIPKVSVQQDKNIRLLLGFVESQRFDSGAKLAEATFALKGYALGMGYRNDEIKRGGSFFKKLKELIITGANTYIQIPDKGKGFVTYEPFYSIETPLLKKGIWEIRFNDWIASSIIELLNKKAKQYFVHSSKEIADRHTTNNPMLHRFYNYLISLRPKPKQRGCTIPMKIETLLKEITLSNQYLKRPDALFYVVAEPIEYFSLNHPEELIGIRLSDSYSREGNYKEYFDNQLKGLKDFTRNEIKKFLPGNVRDIRDCYISFCMPSAGNIPVPKCNSKQSKTYKSEENIKPSDSSSRNDTVLKSLLNSKLNKMWNLTNNPDLNMTDDKLQGLIKMSINCLGLERVLDLAFEYENKSNGLIHFLQDINKRVN